MILRKPFLPVAVAVAFGLLAGCSSAPKSPEVAGAIQKQLDQAGFKDVSTSQDRDKGVVTLGGHVPSEEEKLKAETIAKSLAGPQVVANQIAVIIPGAESDSKKVNADLDKGIESNLDAVLISEGLRKSVSYKVKNHVVTLTGTVDTPVDRAMAEKVVTTVPNVDQVVNELQVKVNKATSTQ